MTSIDINECTGPNDCNQNCENQLGGYKCSCYPNYVLSANNRTCRGTVQYILLSVNTLCVVDIMA